MNNDSELSGRLLDSGEPAVRFKILVQMLGETSPEEIRKLQQEVAASPRVQRLLSERDDEGTIPGRPYAKWTGAHWVLTDLADIGHPAGDTSLIPLWKQICQWLFGPAHAQKIVTINGRTRRCASQEGNALFYGLKLGLAGERADDLAARLMQWQWPDGGWNCDKRPEASHSSFHETLIPLRGLALHAQMTGNRQSRDAAERAAEVFLKRRLFRRQADNSVIHRDFLQLSYPSYWHYNVLAGLKVLAEAGFIYDERCQDALAWLESKRLADGGLPAETRYYRLSDQRISGRSLVCWGGASKKRLNEFVTADALVALKAAGRLATDASRATEY